MQTITSNDGPRLRTGVADRVRRWCSSMAPPQTTRDGRVPDLELHYTVYAMNRRGRGGSGDARTYSMCDSVGNVGIWFVNGLTVTSGSLVGTISGFQVAGVGNHNGDFVSDILLRNSTTGDEGLWTMTGGSISSGGLVSSLSTSFEMR